MKIFSFIALGKSASGGIYISDPARITNGNINNLPYAFASNYVTVDLGKVHDISDVKVWHYYWDWRTYFESKTEVSADGVTWTSLYDASLDGTYKETPMGRTYSMNTGTPLATDIVYTSSGRPSAILSNELNAKFEYNHAGERTHMRLVDSKALVCNFFYLGGNYEREQRGLTVIERLYLGGTAYSAPAVAIRTDKGAWKIHYIHRDYLGSVAAVSNQQGNAVEKRSYDAWGRLRRPNSLKPYGYGEQPTLFLNRGYTGHEHLPEFGLINMNARLYDPVIGRFLSPDPYVQAPDFSQSYNRYSYCLNNPLIYVDPDGELVWLIPVAIIAVNAGINVYKNWDHIKAANNGWQAVGRFAGYTLIGAADGALSYYIPGGGSILGGALTGGLNSAMRGQSFDKIMFNTGIGFFSGMIGYGVGEGFSQLTKLGLTKMNITSPFINKMVPPIMKNLFGDFAENTTSYYMRNLEVPNSTFSDALNYSLRKENLISSVTGGVIEGSMDYFKYRQELKAKENALKPSPLDLYKSQNPNLEVPSSTPLPIPTDVTPLFPTPIEIFPKSPIPSKRPRGRYFDDIQGRWFYF